MEAMFRFTFMTSRVSALAATRPASSRELNESIILAQQAEADLMSLFLHPNDRQHFPAAIQRAAQNSRIIP
jgi:hypothetical protein